MNVHDRDKIDPDTDSDPDPELSGGQERIRS